MPKTTKVVIIILLIILIVSIIVGLVILCDSIGNFDLYSFYRIMQAKTG